MSYAASLALQQAMFTALNAAPALADIPVFDAPPPGHLPPLFIQIGSESVRDASDMTAGGSVHDLDVWVVCDGAGFAAAKTVAGIVSDLLVDADLPLSTGRLVGLSFRKARARRLSGDTRRIELMLRARIDHE